VVLALDGAVHAVPAASVSGRPVESLDGARRLTEVTVEVSDATLVSDDPTAVTALWDRGAWASAAQAVGVAQRLLDLTVTYVAEREQFGRPVGANQAVKHHCSNVAIAVEFARPIVQAAAWSLANGRAPEGTIPPGVTGEAGPSTLVSMAKAMASDAVDLACRSALQCHGAIGYTVEHDLQLWLKRGWALSASWGDAHRHRRRVAVDLGMVAGSGTSAR
jgi:alkylation response protein AidB-like acyl-CoA dehydrogenase